MSIMGPEPRSWYFILPTQRSNQSARGGGSWTKIVHHVHIKSVCPPSLMRLGRLAFLHWQQSKSVGTCRRNQCLVFYHPKRETASRRHVHSRHLQSAVLDWKKIWDCKLWPQRGQIYKWWFPLRLQPKYIKRFSNWRKPLMEGKGVGKFRSRRWIVLIRSLVL